jgi:hypothetical protein
MASTFTIKKYYGSSPGTATAAASYMHLLAADVDGTGSTDYQTGSNQITVPTSGTTYSYEAWWMANWAGTFNSISSVKCYFSGSNPPTGVTVNGGVKSSSVTTTRGSGYVTPVNTVSSYATTAHGSWNSSGTALTPAVKVVGANDNFAEWVVLQLAVTSSAGPGDVGPLTYTWAWTES